MYTEFKHEKVLSLSRFYTFGNICGVATAISRKYSNIFRNIFRVSSTFVCFYSMPDFQCILWKMAQSSCHNIGIPSLLFGTSDFIIITLSRLAMFYFQPFMSKADTQFFWGICDANPRHVMNNDWNENELTKKRFFYKKNVNGNIWNATNMKWKSKGNVLKLTHAQWVSLPWHAFFTRRMGAMWRNNILFMISSMHAINPAGYEIEKRNIVTSLCIETLEPPSHHTWCAWLKT